MSLNFGNAACDAAARLRQHQDWQHIRDSIEDQARKYANAALDVDHALQAAACVYARALRDVFVALEAATHQVKHQQVKVPGAAEPTKKA